ncbi:MAG: hypothetical protein V5A36_07745 [Natronomonas sp.]
MARLLLRSVGATAVGVVLAATLAVPVAAQQPEPSVSPLGQAVSAMGISLVIGGGLIVLAPEFTERTTEQIHDRPVDTLLYGIAVGLAITIALVVLIVTLVGILLAVPLAVLTLVLSELGYLAVGRTVTDNWAVVLAVAVGLSAIVGGVPVFGFALGIVLSSLGLGTTYLYYREDD